MGYAKAGDRRRLRRAGAISSMLEVTWIYLVSFKTRQLIGNFSKKLRQLGFKVEAFYMSESDPALRQRLSELYHPRKLSSDCAKYKGFLS